MYLIHLLGYSPHRGRYRVAALFFWRWALSESFLDLAKSKRWVGFASVSTDKPLTRMEIATARSKSTRHVNSLLKSTVYDDDELMLATTNQ